MNSYQEGLEILDGILGKGKDNIIALATISLELSERGNPQPCVRDVDAYYEEGVFYIVTYALSNKVFKVSRNPEVSIAADFEDFSSCGIAENLGWVLDPKNADIRTKLRTIFKEWYDFANNEEDPNFCFVAIRLTKGTLRLDHGQRIYRFDFENKTAESFEQSVY